MTGSMTREDKVVLRLRRDKVRAAVLERGFARIDDLAREFDVSVMTMHRDLDALTDEGWLTKIRGGATANPSALLNAGVQARRAVLRAEKQAIAAHAANLLHHGQTIFLDDSTTALALAPHLAERAPITVVTNFIPVIASLSGHTDVELVVLGGQYQRTAEACFGLQTIDAIRNLRADLFFMSTTAVTDGNCYHRSESTVMSRRAFMECSARNVLLVDHGKFGRPAPHLLCPVTDFDLVVTDDQIDEQDLAELRALGAAVEVAALPAG